MRAGRQARPLITVVVNVYLIKDNDLLFFYLEGTKTGGYTEFKNIKTLDFVNLSVLVTSWPNRTSVLYICSFIY